MKKLKLGCLLVMMVILSSCSEDDFVIDYSNIPSTFELGDDLPDLSKLIMIQVGQNKLDGSSLITNNINTDVVGDYIVTIGLSGINRRNPLEDIQIPVSIVDSTPPRIVYEPQSMRLHFGYAFNTDLITCEDLSGCEINHKNFEYRSAGKNVGVVTATDSFGNVVVEEIEYTVVENESPVLKIDEKRIQTINGYALKFGSEFRLPNIIASEIDGLKPSIELMHSVNTNKLGVYEVSISLTDSFGHRLVKYMDYHVVDNLQLNFVNNSIEDVKEIDEGFLILASAYVQVNRSAADNASGNPLFDHRNTNLEEWNGQTLSLINRDYELVWTVPINSSDISYIVGIRTISSEGIFLFGSSSRTHNGLSPCQNNPAASQTVGTILKFNFEGELVARSTDFGTNCSSSYRDLTIFSNRIYVASEVYIDGSENYSSLFSLVILDSNLNELESKLYINQSFHRYKIYGKSSVGMPIFNNSVWIPFSVDEVVELDFSGNELSNGLVDIRYDGDGQNLSNFTRVITSVRNICSMAGQRWNNTSILSNGTSLIHFFDITVGPIIQGGCENQDALLLIYDKSSTQLSTFISDLDTSVSGSKIISLGLRERSIGSSYLVFTDKEIVEIQENLRMAVFGYEIKIDQLGDFYNDLSYQLIVARDSSNPEKLFSALVMRESFGRSSVLVLN